MIDPALKLSFELLGLPVIMPEPEVAAADLARIRARSLAGLIVSLINENEPMLCASFDGATVTVRERGSAGVMKFTIQGESK